MFEPVKDRDVLVAFRVSRDEREGLRSEAQQRGVSMSELTRRAIGAYIKQEEVKSEQKRGG
jgi:hypothetical protein